MSPLGHISGLFVVIDDESRHLLRHLWHRTTEWSKFLHGFVTRPQRYFIQRSFNHTLAYCMSATELRNQMFLKSPYTSYLQQLLHHPLLHHPFCHAESPFVHNVIIDNNPGLWSLSTMPINAQSLTARLFQLDSLTHLYINWTNFKERTPTQVDRVAGELKRKSQNWKKMTTFDHTVLQWLTGAVAHFCTIEVRPPDRAIPLLFWSSAPPVRDESTRRTTMRPPLLLRANMILAFLNITEKTSNLTLATLW